ncbi:MAG: hypothetical protein GF350_02670 [Chitinivibrionales bacterium]|nr:hypothetical protein [Chitinivibrionales bacterium]
MKKSEKQPDCGSVLITVIVIAVIGTIAGIVTLGVTNNLINTSRLKRNDAALLNIAEAGKEYALSKLRSQELELQEGQKIIGGSDISFGAGAFTVTCSANAPADCVWVVSTAEADERSKAIEVIATVVSGKLNINLTGIRGAVTTRGDFSSLGNIEIDGQDYNEEGTSVEGDGCYGVSSCGTTVSVGGSSATGGNGNGPPKRGEAANSVERRVTCEGYPETPEDVLGLPDGALEQFKTDECPAAGFQGLLYTERDCDVTGSGIYICHNESGTASLTNFHGNFKGLIIADRVTRVNGNGTIVGAVITLSELQGSNTFGNGNARIKYSSAALNKLEEYCSDVELDVEITEVSWREL